MLRLSHKPSFQGLWLAAEAVRQHHSAASILLRSRRIARPLRTLIEVRTESLCYCTFYNGIEWQPLRVPRGLLHVDEQRPDARAEPE
jgi:hypothetical protein